MLELGLHEGKDIDDAISDWQFVPSEISARLVQASDNRYVIQMRVDLGVLQMEIRNRPDGSSPFGFKTYLAYLKHSLAKKKSLFSLDKEHISESLRELRQYSQRRVCWLNLRRYSAVLKDADHCISIINFIRDRSQDTQLLANLESDRLIILLHRIQAVTMLALAEHGPVKAVEEVNAGIRRIKETVAITTEKGETNAALIASVKSITEQLVDLEVWIQKRYGLKPALYQRLVEAIRNEEYEKAAEIRDLIEKYRKTSILTNSELLDDENTVKEVATQKIKGNIKENKAQNEKKASQESTLCDNKKFEPTQKISSNMSNNERRTKNAENKSPLDRGHHGR
ncbi:MAG: UvrB/UvrC motif-containing protein [Thermoguttaceae bacterium]